MQWEAVLLDMRRFEPVFIEHAANGLVLQSPLISAARSLSMSACIM
jgi:hypothetical protein